MQDSSTYGRSTITEGRAIKSERQRLPPKAPSSTVLRHRRKSLWLPAVYVLLLVVPWIIDCVLMFKPYSYHQRDGLSIKNTLNSEGWLLASLVIAKIQTLVAIPIVSTLLAQAAVVYSQRSSSTKKLSVRQLLVLADQAWGGIPGFWRARHRGVGSRLVTVGGLLILLVAVQPPVQSLFAGMEAVRIVTCYDTPVRGCDPFNIDQEVGFDPEPSNVQQLPSIIPVSRVSSKILAAADMDQQPYLWPEQWINVDDADRIMKSTLWWYANAETFGNDQNYTYFVSSLMNGTNTGILRQLGMRLNSTTSCTNEDVSAFPATCSGGRPFVSALSLHGMNISICAPGNYEETPWTLSRNRQDVSEELWIDLAIDPTADEIYTLETQWGELTNWTLHCTVDTTRGYFEIPNVYTNNNPGPLLGTWPSQEEMAKDWNDYLSVMFDYAIPTAWDNFTSTTSIFPWQEPVDAYYSGYPEAIAPGPLMISTLAMFGNNSWWHAVTLTSNETTSVPTNDTITQSLTSICQTAAIPFTAYQLTVNSFGTVADNCIEFNDGLENDDVEGQATRLRSILYGWFYCLNNEASGNDTSGHILDATTFFANEAVLTSAADLKYVGGAKWIYYNKGSVFYQPYKSLGGMVAVTVLIFLQVTALLVLVWYIHGRAPVWTDTLDAFAMMRIGAEMGRRATKGEGSDEEGLLDQKIGKLGLGLRFADERDLAKLKGVDGLVGVVPMVLAESNIEPIGEVVPPEGCEGEHGGLPWVSEQQKETEQEEVLDRLVVLGLGAPGIITKATAGPGGERQKR